MQLLKIEISLSVDVGKEDLERLRQSAMSAVFDTFDIGPVGSTTATVTGREINAVWEQGCTHSHTED